MTNGVLQVSKSFKYVINSNGEIKELRLNGKPINRKKTYWVASTTLSPLEVMATGSLLNQLNMKIQISS